MSRALRRTSSCDIEKYPNYSGLSLIGGKPFWQALSGHWIWIHSSDFISPVWRIQVAMHCTVVAFVQTRCQPAVLEAMKEFLRSASRARQADAHRDRLTMIAESCGDLPQLQFIPSASSSSLVSIDFNMASLRRATFVCSRPCAGVSTCS